MRSNLSSMLDLLGRHDAAVEGARFVGASFAYVLAPMHRAGPAEAGRVNRERISAGSPRRNFGSSPAFVGRGRRTIMPRELIEPRTGDKRYVRRKKGKFTTKQASVGRSLTADRRSKAKRIVPKGEGDRGDQRR
jgi:hypothetical protein